MTDPDLKALEQKHIMQTYPRTDIIFVRGEGCYVYDSEGKKYLDFLGGIATCTVGHGNEEVAKAVYEQMQKLNGVSNLYYMEPQVLLAKRLSELSGLAKAFFSHSGADSNETAIKLAEKVTGKKHFIAFEEGFHGRTTGSLALTWKQDIKEPFLPLAPAASFAKYGDVSSAEALITADTAAIVVEPIQGESGIVDPGEGFLTKLRKLCDDHEILLIIDEVQTGIGRTGKFFAYQHEGIKPDIVTIAKGLGNGVPIGVCLSDFELEKGEHGSTLGGNNVSCAAALATIEYIDKHDLVNNAERTGSYLMKALESLKDDNPLVKTVRGRGLMVGLVLSEPKAAQIVAKCLELGLICNAPTPDVLRFLPPLIVSEEQIDECINILKESMK